MNQIDIEGIRAREQSATPEPWCISEKGNTVKSLSIDGICHGMSPKQTDAEFIAHAREDIPYLLSQLAEREREIERLHSFKEYFDEFYGQGLEVANWHLNGNTEPFDSFYDSAVEYMNDPLPAAPEEGKQI